MKPECNQIWTIKCFKSIVFISDNLQDLKSWIYIFDDTACHSVRSCFKMISSSKAINFKIKVKVLISLLVDYRNRRSLKQEYFTLRSVVYNKNRSLLEKQCFALWSVAYNRNRSLLEMEYFTLWSVVRIKNRRLLKMGYITLWSVVYNKSRSLLRVFLSMKRSL